MKNQRLSRREFLRSTSLTGLGLTLVACVAPSAPPESQVGGQDEDVPALEQTELVFGHSFRNNAIDMLGENFKEEHPDTTIMPMFFQTDEELWKKLALGALLDIITLNSSSAGVISPEVFLPLDSYLDNSYDYVKENCHDVTLKVGQWNGEQYGIPVINYFAEDGLIINKKIADEAGLDTKKPPQTWTKLYEWSEAMTQSDDSGNPYQIGFDPYWLSIYTLLNSCGKGIYDEANQEFNFNDECWVSVLEQLKTLKTFGPITRMGEWWTRICTGAQGMYIGGYQSPRAIAQMCEYDQEWIYTWVPVPDGSGREEVQYQRLGGDIAMISANTKDPDKAMEFLAYLSTNEANQILYALTGSFAITKTWPNKQEPDDRDEGLDWYIQSVNEAGELYIREPFPSLSGLPELWKQFMDDEISREEFQSEMVMKGVACAPKPDAACAGPMGGEPLIFGVGYPSPIFVPVNNADASVDATEEITSTQTLTPTQR